MQSSLHGEEYIIDNILKINFNYHIPELISNNNIMLFLELSLGRNLIN